MDIGTSTGPSSALQGAELQPSAGRALDHHPITFMLLHDTHLSANKEPRLLQGAIFGVQVYSLPSLGKCFPKLPL